jgi:tRNA threonylcarbamoyladenosine biosynthesis protein TsaB
MFCSKLLEMYFLAVDTATNSGGVALARNAELIGTVQIKRPLEYSEHLLSQVEFLLGQFRLALKEIDAFVVASGPGSFTGLRIGLATVKGFSQALGRPVSGVSTLEALAYRFRHVCDRVAPMIDARRQQVFGALYDVGEEGESRPVHPERVAPPARWLIELPDERCLFVGDGAQMYASTVASLRPSDSLIRSDNTILPELCLLGYHRFVRGETGDAGSLIANYVRPSDAELSTTNSTG